MNDVLTEEVVFLAGLLGVMSILVMIGVAAYLVVWVLQNYTNFRAIDAIDRLMKNMGM